MELCPQLRKCTDVDHVLDHARKQFWFNAAELPAFYELPERIKASRAELTYILSSRKGFTSHPTYQKILVEYGPSTDDIYKNFSRPKMELEQSNFATKHLKPG